MTTNQDKIHALLKDVREVIDQLCRKHKAGIKEYNEGGSEEGGLGSTQCRMDAKFVFYPKRLWKALGFEEQSNESGADQKVATDTTPVTVDTGSRGG